jgi:nitrate/nitrite transporter NarK
MTDRNSTDLVTEPRQPDKSLPELFHDLTSELGALFRKEVELAKAEARQELRDTGRAAGMFGGAGVGGWMAVLFISLALAWLLDQALNRALAFAIVAVIWGIVAAVLFSTAKQRMQKIRALPETKETIKEDVQWAKTRKP